MFMTKKQKQDCEKLGLNDSRINKLKESKLFPKKLENVDFSFLHELQKFHDGDSYWSIDNNDISYKGINYIKTICEINNIDFNKLKLNKPLSI